MGENVGEAAQYWLLKPALKECMDTVLEAGSDDYELSRSLVSALAWLP